MKDLQTILSQLERSRGQALPSAQLVEQFQNARPLDQAGFSVLMGCIAQCSEQIYEHYRALVDLFREEIHHTQPDAQTIHTGIALGILDDEEWEG